MSVAVPIDTRSPLRPEFLAHGTVSVREFGFAHCAAGCTCGWGGRRRYLKAAAEQDAWMHSIREHCTVSVPLVIPVVAGAG